MTESMIERVGKSIGQALVRNSLGECLLIATDDQCNEIAQAAIQAMREPTEAMWLADGLVDHMHPTDAWEIMIDAALRWPPGSADRAGVPMAED